MYARIIGIGIILLLCKLLTATGIPTPVPEEAKPLVLRKGDQVVMITTGWWVAAEGNGYEVLGTGRYQDIRDGTIILMEPLKKYNREHRIPVTDIKLLYQGEAHRIPHYTKRGLVKGTKIGGTTGVIIGRAVGGFLGLLGYSMYWGRTDAEGEEPMSKGKYIAYIMAQGALAGGLPSGLIGALFGTLGGTIIGQVKHDNAEALSHRA